MKEYKRIVVKVGSSTLTYDTGRINLRLIELLSRTLSDLRHEGKDIVLVTSGAMSAGMGKLGLREKPKDIMGRQAIAAVGQSEIMSIYDKLFSEYGCDVAQILLTKNVLEDDVRKQNAINTFNKLFEWGVVPIVNENDTISTEEIEFGDNDTLSATVACLVSADLLIILTDIDGLYDKNPKEYDDAKLIPYVYEITSEIVNSAGGAGSKIGTGGMCTKIKAAKITMGNKIDTVIVNGKAPSVIYDILDGKQIGTKFMVKDETDA